MKKGCKFLINNWPEIIILSALAAAIYGAIWSAFSWQEFYDKDDCVAVYYHDATIYSAHYTVLKQDGVELKTVTFPDSRLPTKIIADVPAGSNMWYVVDYKKSGLGSFKGKVEVHVRSVDDITK